MIGTGDRDQLFIGYTVGAALMVAAAVFEWLWGVEAAGRPLESVSGPAAQPARPARVVRGSGARPIPIETSPP